MSTTRALRRRLLCFGAASFGLGAHALARPPAGADQAPTGRILHVGPARELTSPSQAARVARDGDLIEIDAGDYLGDVAVWKQQRLAIRAAGGPVRLVANGRSAEKKAIWVVRGGDIQVEGIEFRGARVPDRNGAGIRFERGRLVVSRCRFIDNENGILTGNDGVSELSLDRCEFEGKSQSGEGFTHNLYVGAIARFAMRGCWSHHGNAGHLVKTRARESRLYCNRITDEPGGRASYEVDAPNGGLVILVGNLLAQEPTNQNNALVSFGAEGYRWPENRLILAYNTLVNRGPIGVFARIYPGPATSLVENSLFTGEGLFDGVTVAEGRGNFFASPADFVDPARFDYRLRPRSALRGRSAAPSNVPGETLVPTHEYVHPLGLRPLVPVSTASVSPSPASTAPTSNAPDPSTGAARRSPGAFQS